MINRENSLLFLLSLFLVFSVRCLLSVFIPHLLHVSLDLHTYSDLQCEFVSFNRIFRRIVPSYESGKQEETENLKRVHVFKENDEEEKETQFSTNETEIKFMEKVVLVRCSWCGACAFNIAT